MEDWSKRFSCCKNIAKEVGSLFSATRLKKNRVTFLVIFSAKRLKKKLGHFLVQKDCKKSWVILPHISGKEKKIKKYVKK